MHRSRSQAGQVLPLVAALIALIALLAVAVGHVGTRAVGRARAQAAADAAALAGAGRGRAAADELARANGAIVVSYAEPGGDVRVEVVDKGGEHAVAQARAVGAVGPLAPAMGAVLARAAQVLGEPLTPAEIDPSGLAIRVPPAQVAAVTERGAEAGLCPSPARPGWFEICPP